MSHEKKITTIPPEVEDAVKQRFTREDLARYIRPIWEGNTVHGETLMFVPDAKTGEIAPAPLLYKPDKVLAVRSPDGSILFEEGMDYTVTPDGCIALTVDTRIYRWSYDDYYLDHIEQYGLPSRSAAGRFLKYAEGDFFTKTQVWVTYTHSDGWTGPVPRYAGDRLAKTVAKLEAGEPLRIVYNGDSICVGCNASGWLGNPPYIPSWTDLITRELGAVYAAPITAVNTAVGGTIAQWGADNVEENILRYKPDLVVLRFGTNDATQGYTTAFFKENMERILQAVRADNPACEFILVANTPCNPDVEGWSTPHHVGNQQAVFELAEQYPGVAAVAMLDIEAHLLTRKRYWDMAGNNINHFNDFMTRVQGSAVAQLLVKNL